MDQKKKDYETINQVWEMLKYSYDTKHDDKFWEKEVEMASKVDRDDLLAKRMTVVVLEELERRSRQWKD